MDTRKQAREYDLEYGMPACKEALEYAKCSLIRSKMNKDGCAIFIHGYGSTGNGGVIREEFRHWINIQKNKGVVKTVVNGEDFTIFNSKALELKNKFKGLDYLLNVCNHGVTVVAL